MSNCLLCKVGSVLVISCCLSALNLLCWIVKPPKTSQIFSKISSLKRIVNDLYHKCINGSRNEDMNALVFNSSATQCGLAKWHNWLVLLLSAFLYYISDMLTNDKLHLHLLDKIPDICYCLTLIVMLLSVTGGRQKQPVPPKHFYPPTKLHSVITQKSTVWMINNVKISKQILE